MLDKEDESIRVASSGQNLELPALAVSPKFYSPGRGLRKMGAGTASGVGGRVGIEGAAFIGIAVITAA